jgi:hypothetical protein
MCPSPPYPLPPCSAADIAKENSRATVSAADVLTALRELEFDDFLPNVEVGLTAYRETEKARSIEAAAKRAAALAQSAEAAADEGDGDAEAAGADGEREAAAEVDITG